MPIKPTKKKRVKLYLFQSIIKSAKHISTSSSLTSKRSNFVFSSTIFIFINLNLNNQIHQKSNRLLQQKRKVLNRRIEMIQIQKQREEKITSLSVVEMICSIMKRTRWLWKRRSLEEAVSLWSSVAMRRSNLSTSSWEPRVTSRSVDDIFSLLLLP